MSLQSTQAKSSTRTRLSTFLRFLRMSWNRNLLTRRVVVVFLGIFMLTQSGHLHGTEVQHACDAKVFKPCPAFSASVQLGEHSTIFDSKTFGYTRSKGSWTVNVKYGPPESCAKITLFVEVGPLQFDRIYKRVFVNGGGTINDSGVFMYKTSQSDSALRVASSSCYIPNETSELSSSPDPALNSFDRELEEQGFKLGVHEEQKSVLDDALEGLALQEQQAQMEDMELMRQAERERERQLREFERDKELRRMQEQVQNIIRERERRERERIARMQRENESGDGISTFLEILGTGMTLYDMYNQYSPLAGSNRDAIYGEDPGTSNNQGPTQGYKSGNSNCYISCATD